MKPKTSKTNLRELKKGLERRGISWSRDEKDLLKGNLGIEMDSLNALFELIQIIQFIAQVNVPVFTVTQNKNQKIVTTSDKLSDGLSSRMYKALGTTEGELDELKKQFPLHKASPYLDCFLTVLKNHTFTIYSQVEKIVETVGGVFVMGEAQEAKEVHSSKLIHLYYNLEQLTASNLMAYEQQSPDKNPCQFIADIFNSLIETLQQALNNPQFKLNVRNFEKVTHDVYSGAVKYIEKLVDRTPEPWCVRFKLWCVPEKPDKNTDHKLSPEQYMETAETQYQQMKAYRDSLFKLLRKNKLFAACWSGYVWKLEHSLSKDFHFDFLFVFDGAARDAQLVTIIEEAWKLSVTQGIGFSVKDLDMNSTANGNLNCEQYKANLKVQLRNIMMQMTQTDQYLRIKREFGGCFGKGQIKYRKTERAASATEEEQTKAALKEEISKARKLERANRKLRKELEQLKDKQR